MKEKTEQLVVVSNNNIQNLIHTIRGKQVILDKDVAELYNYETKYINLTVRRNKARFPEEFCFQLTASELENLRLQFATSSLRFQNETSKQELNIHGGRRYLPYVFTEQGIAMLAGVLKSEIAVAMSINIINAFVEMRKFLIGNGQIFERLTNIEYKLLENDKKFNDVFNQLQAPSIPKQKVFFEGQIFDAYSLIIDIIKLANRKIIVIDNYIDDSVLKMLSKKKEGVEVKIITSNKSSIRKIDVKKFNKEYSKLSIEKTESFHDRFIIIDDEKIYHCGASIKDLGKKCFAITELEDRVILEKIEEYNKAGEAFI